MRGKHQGRDQKHDEAERAVRLAVARTGHLVPGSEIGRAWVDANGAGPLPKEAFEGRWQRLLRFALASGDVFVRRESGVFWGVRGGETMSPLPPASPAPRAFTDVLLERCARAEAALAQAVAERGRLVTSAEVCAILDQDDGASGAIVPARLRRVLEPAIVSGRVNATSIKRTLYFGPSERPELVHPGLGEGSDLAKVEEALRRSVASQQAAVAAEVVASVINDEPELALRSTRLTVAHHLQTLAGQGRAKRVQPRKRGARTRIYYTTPDGPSHIDWNCALEMDRRRRGVDALWRLTEGRPFTTAAIRRFASERSAYRIEDDPPFGWTNALHHLQRTGEVVAIRGPHGRHVRWALAADWNKLTDATRAERLLDEFRIVEPNSRSVAFETSGSARPRYVLSPSAPEHDVAFVSMNQNMRTLVLLAKQIAAADAGSREEAVLLASRPVTVGQVSRAAEECAHLLGGRSDIRMRLHEATRVRPGMQCPAVVNVGAVGRTSYFDIERTEVAAAFVAFRRAIWEARRARLLDESERLQEAAALSADRVQPVPAGALSWWARTLLQRSCRLVAQIEESLRAAQLLESERLEARAVLHALHEPTDGLPNLIASFGENAGEMEACVPAPLSGNTLTIDVADAWSQISSVAHFRLTNPRLLQTRIARSVGTVTRSTAPELEEQSGRRGGRRIETYFDRVAFTAYALMRWAGPGWATCAAHGLAALGAVRSAQPFIECLRTDNDTRLHAGAAAALGLLDDTVSRAALAEYIVRMLEAEACGGRLAPMAALVSAAYGLAPKPIGGVADRVTGTERAALTVLCERRASDYVGRCARRTLVAWDEHWDRAQLMNL